MDIPDALRSALADRYAIERELGQGGMATVYLAEDLKHHRKVALKVLRPELAVTIGAGRFSREIEVAARLQHPNILPLLDSGEAAGFFFYVMPYVEGESLRERLARGGELPVQDAVRILMEVADALSEAHAHGVVHRDIKPDNVMLRGRHALVADFGVAKAVTEATGQQLLTSTGVALGTPMYMAPEQAMADPHQDHRVDIYALGLLGYELLTGRAPFSATSAQEMLAAHVTAVPDPVEKYRAAVSPVLAAIIMKCLAKKPADRWQTAEEVLQRLEPLATPSGGTTPTQTQPTTALVRLPRWAKWAAGVAAVAAVSLVATQLLKPRPLSITVSDIAQVTNDPGVEFQPAISPDGKEVAFASGSIRALHLVVKGTVSTAGGGEIRLADTTLRREMFPSWSPEGDFVRFRDCRAGVCEWNETGKLGGAVRPASLPRRAASANPVAWSPDGARVAFVAADSIFVASVGDTTAHFVAVHTDNFWWLHSLAWSPDGRLIAYVNGNPQWLNSGNISPSSIWVVRSSGGKPKRITTDQFLNVSPVWLDAGHLLFVSDRDGARGAYVVAAGADGARGEPRIIPGIADPHSIAYSAATRTLAFAKFNVRQNVWAYPLHPSAPVSIADGVRITTGNQVIETLDVSPDGNWLVFDNNRRGTSDLYKVPLAGGDAVQLTDLPSDEFSPRWSPDGSEIAFHTGNLRGGGRSSIMVQSARGGTPVALATSPGFNTNPAWSPDGLHIAFLATRTGRQETWVLSRDSVGGRWHEARQLTDFQSAPWDWAPDGSGVLLWAGGNSLGLVSPQGRLLWRRDLAATSRLTGMLWCRYARDGRTIYGSATDRGGRRGIWAIPGSAGEARLVVAADDPALDLFVGGFAVGPDRLYLTVSEYESDIWVAKLRW